MSDFKHVFLGGEACDSYLKDRFVVFRSEWGDELEEFVAGGDLGRYISSEVVVVWWFEGGFGIAVAGLEF